MTLRLRLWIEDDRGFSLGPGLAEMLRKIEELGSLRKAAESMGMSYRRAWGRLKRNEAALGRALVVKRGGNKAGYELTEFGSGLVKAYFDWIESVEAFALRKAQEVLPPSLADGLCTETDGPIELP